MIIFIYGENTFSSRKKLKELKDKFIREKDPDGNNISYINGLNAEAGDLKNSISASSLFARKRLVIIENIFVGMRKDLLKEIYDFLQIDLKKDRTADERNILIFFEESSGGQAVKTKLWKFLLKQPYAQNFKSMSNTEATVWLRRRAKDLGADLPQQVALNLSSLFGSNLWQLDNELKKLVHFKRGQSAQLLDSKQDISIEQQDIDLMCRGQVDENIFAFTDAISAKNKQLALELFEREIEAGVAQIYLLHMILRQFRILIQVKQAIENGFSSRKIIQNLKLHPFVVQKSISQTRGFSLPVLIKIFKDLVDIDKKLKIGASDLRTEMSLLITKEF